MSSKRSNIYNWERFSKPRVYSSSQRVTKDDDIQDWIKKVEDASSRAAAATFGTKHVPSYHSTKAAISATIEDVHIHDAAYSEAQELLEQWAAEKIHLSGDEDSNEETWTKKTEAEIRREWDHLLDPDDEQYDLEDVQDQTSRTPANTDPYSILEKDDASIVEDVMQKLLEKQVVGSHVLDDLGLDSSYTNCKDPRTRMKLRHQQVKENREKRERERKKKLKELQAKKDAYFTAKQIIKKEDQLKAIQKKKEEEAVQREMAKIRKEMEEAKKRQREERLREQKEKEQFNHCVEEKVNQQNLEICEEEKRHHMQAKYRQKLIMERLQELQTKEALDNLKLLQKCFSSWYSLVLQRHLQIGKAKAMADWKLVLKTFNAWKSYSRTKRLEKEAILHETEIKILQKKKLISEQHYTQKLLRRCFLGWQLYVLGERHKKYLNSQQNQTKNKMAAFLQAAASGKLWSSRSEDENQTSRSQQTGSVDEKAASQKVDALFEGNSRQAAPSGDEAAGMRRTSGGRRRTNSGPNQLQAWQITRKHVQITKDDLARVKEKNGTEDVDETSTAKSSKAKKAIAINTYEHRHLAQQKILEMQQKQIKEQQRLIEEMQFLQKQQMLQQQLTQHQLVQQKSGWIAADSKSTAVEQLQIRKPGQTAADNDDTVVTDLTIEDLEKLNGEADSDVTNEHQTFNQNTSRTVSSTMSKLSSNNKSVNFLKAMEERARERARLKKERDEKRKQAEEERIRALQAQEEERRREEEEERKRRAESYREKKRLEKQRELEKKKQLEHMKELTDLADRHNRLAVIKYQGWLPWRQLLTMARNNTQYAQEHYKKELLRKALLKWHNHVKEDLAHKRALADDMFNYILIRRCFGNWKKVRYYMVIEEEKACRHFEVSLKAKVVRAWADYTMDEKMAMWKKERLAKEHNTKRVVLTAFRAWRRYPRLIQEEKERHRRLEEMRKKVSSLLPDFSGVSFSETSTDFEC